jgi:hypothetical protein
MKRTGANMIKRILFAIALAALPWSAQAANELQLNTGETGRTEYVVISDQSGQAWNVTGTPAFSAYSTTRSNFVISATEVSGTGLYRASFPSTMAAGQRHWEWFLQAGGSPSHADDISLADGSGYWNRSTLGVNVVSGGGLSDTAFNDEEVPPIRTFKLKASNQSNEVLVGETTLKLTVGNSATFAFDFAADLPTNGRVESVDTVAIYSGTDGGATFGTTGREDSQGKVRITGVTAGTYVIQADVTYHNGDTRTGRGTLKVVQ